MDDPVMGQILAPLTALILGIGFAALGYWQRPAAGPAQPWTIDTEGMSSEQVYRAVCGACHAAHHPRAFTREQWRSVVDEMQQRADHRGVSITPWQIERVLEYLEENGR
jgi:hypothetical protein